MSLVIENAMAKMAKVVVDFPSGQKSKTTICLVYGTILCRTALRGCIFAVSAFHNGVIPSLVDVACALRVKDNRSF